MCIISLLLFICVISLRLFTASNLQVQEKYYRSHLDECILRKNKIIIPTNETLKKVSGFKLRTSRKNNG